jgi:hypothetical protein
VGQEKFVFWTVYHFGTSGELNHSRIMNSLRPFYSGWVHKNIFIVGDFNLCSVEWPLSETYNSVNRLDKMILNSFFELGLQQFLAAVVVEKRSCYHTTANALAELGLFRWDEQVKGHVNKGENQLNFVLSKIAPQVYRSMGNMIVEL